MNIKLAFKAVTYETLQEPTFQEAVRKAYPLVDFDKPFGEFVAARADGGHFAKGLDRTAVQPSCMKTCWSVRGKDGGVMQMLSDEQEAWLRQHEGSLEQKIDRFRMVLSEELSSIQDATEALELAFDRRAKDIKQEWNQRMPKKAQDLFEKANAVGTRCFASLDDVIEEVQRTFQSPDPKLEEIYNEWLGLQNDFDQQQRREANDYATTFLWYGTVIGVHATLERSLTAFCDLLREHRNERRTVQDMKGQNDQQRCKKYLETVHGVSVENAYWKALEPLRLIRNRIAHDNGLCQEDWKASVHQILEEPGSSVRLHKGRILLDASFIRGSVGSVYQLFDQLQKKARQKLSLRLVSSTLRDK